jgi:hypothetical protein
MIVSKAKKNRSTARDANAARKASQSRYTVSFSHRRCLARVDRLEPCESWRPYVVAAIPQQVEVREGPTERKTGLYVPNVETVRLVRDERGWLRLAG